MQFLASGLLPARLPGTKDDALFYSHAEQISTLDVAFSVLHRNAPQDELDCRIINVNCLIALSLLPSSQGAETTKSHVPGASARAKGASARYALSPKDMAHPAGVTAIRALLEHNRQSAPAKCNIGCCLSLA